jgi:hypothetical protein
MSDENFFIRKQIKVAPIEEPKEYDLNNESDILSCGLDKESFAKRNLEMFGGGDLDKSKNPVAQMSIRLEQHFSKREIAFLLSTTMLQSAFEEAQEKTKNGK